MAPKLPWELNGDFYGFPLQIPVPNVFSRARQTTSSFASVALHISTFLGRFIVADRSLNHRRLRFVKHFAPKSLTPIIYSLKLQKKLQKHNTYITRNQEKLLFQLLLPSFSKPCSRPLQTSLQFISRQTRFSA